MLPEASYNNNLPETKHRQSKNEEQHEHHSGVSVGQHTPHKQDPGDDGHGQRHLQEAGDEPGESVPAEVHAHHWHELGRYHC